MSVHHGDPGCGRAVGVDTALRAGLIYEVALAVRIAADSLDFDMASQIETRGFVELVLTEEVNQRISAFFEANSQRCSG